MYSEEKLQMATENLRIITLLPTIGILIFICLYLYATQLYPRGSQANVNSIGFDWVNNYWCNLMNKNGMNGLENPARPIAISAMTILCSSFLIFFFQFAKFYVKNKILEMIIRGLGTLSMISATIIFTRFHDIMTTVSSIFVILVVIGIIRVIYKSNWCVFKISGIVCIVLLVINNLIYYSGYLLEYLQLIQKITFVLILTWIIGLNLNMKNKKKLYIYGDKI